MGKRQKATSNSLLTFFVLVFDRGSDAYLESIIKEQSVLSIVAGISFSETNKMSLLELDMVRDGVTGYFESNNNAVPRNPEAMGMARIF